MKYNETFRFPNIPDWEEPWPFGHYWHEPVNNMMLSIPKNWEFEELGFYPYGHGDAGIRLAKCVIAYPDLRHIFLPPLIKCVKEHIRWIGEPAPPRIKGRNAFGKRFKRSYVHQHKGYSRDHFSYGVFALYWVGGAKLLNDLDIQCKLKWWRLKFRPTPTIKWWFKALESGLKDEKAVRKYHFWLRFEIAFGFGMKLGYVRSLHAHQLFCVPNEELQEEMLERTPQWNIHDRLLLGDHVTEEEVENYRSRTGWQWSANEWHEPDPPNDWTEYIPETQRFLLDKDIIKAMYARIIKFR